MAIDLLETRELRDLEDRIEQAFLAKQIDGETQALAFIWLELNASCIH